jgi:SAM-dependent methyltransferase
LGEVSGLHLNLGCGHFLLAGHTNIDAYAYEPGVTVLRFPPLPYDDASVDSIYLGHTAEHMPPWDLLPLLAECKRVLKSGGSLTVVVPDADKARLLAESGRLTLTWYALAVQGERNDLMPHFTIWNKVRVRQLLELAGFAIDEAYSWKDDPRVHDTSVIFQAGVRGIKL